MKLSLILLSLVLLTACGQKLHPLEEPPKFKLPQVVKPEDMVAEPILDTEVNLSEEIVNNDNEQVELTEEIDNKEVD